MVEEATCSHRRLMLFRTKVQFVFPILVTFLKMNNPIALRRFVNHQILYIVALI